MGLLTAGKRYTPTEYITFDENTTLIPGQVAELYFEVTSGKIDKWTAHQVLMGVLKLKEQPEYAGIIIHYIDISETRITLQVSSPLHSWTFVLEFLCLAIIAVVALYFLYKLTLSFLQEVGLVEVAPTGNVSVIAVEKVYDENTAEWLPQGELEAPFTFLGESHKTPWQKDKVPTGTYTVVFGQLADHTIAPPGASVTEAVKKDEETEFRGIYCNTKLTIKVNEVTPTPDTPPPPPTTGVLIITTTPVEGEIFLDGNSVGVGYYRDNAVDVGIHTVGCGPVEGYIPPGITDFTVVATETKTVVMEYTPQGFDWKKWLKWGVVGGLAIGGIAAIAKLIGSLRGREKEARE